MTPNRIDTVITRLDQLEAQLAEQDRELWIAALVDAALILMMISGLAILYYKGRQ